MSDGFLDAASLSDIPENSSIGVSLGGEDILLCNTREGVFAVKNQCTHQLQALEGGKIRGCFIFCPLHGQRFSLKDGSPIGQLTDKPLRTYALRIEGDRIMVDPAAPGGGQD